MMGPDYELGIQRLKKALLNKSSRLSEDFLTLEARLARNLHDDHLFGNDPANHVEWARVINTLIRLADEQLGLGFNELCRTDASFATPLVFPGREQARGRSD